MPLASRNSPNDTAPNGAIAGYTLANGVAHSLTQNTRGLPLLWRDAGIVQDQYGYDANGNVTAITDQQEAGATSRSLGYDGLDRLTLASGIWGAGSFGYDPLDNLRSSTVGGRSLQHVVDPATNRLTALGGSQILAIGYDANGNVSARGAQGFTFDIGNRLRTAAGKASYVYDGHGRRMLTTPVDGSWRLQAYSQAGKLLMTRHSAQGYTSHVYLGDRLIAEEAQVGGRQYAHTDALGSPVARSNAAGQVISRTRYEPYGGTAAGTNPTGIGFTGHVNDVDTGLVYMQQRYYDPIAGRFLSVDPVVTSAKTGASFNRYVYGNDNPYAFVDPSGKFAVWVHWSITYTAARDAGYSFGDSLRYANRAWMADWESGSQGKTPEAAARHAMRAGLDSPAQAAARNQALVSGAVARGDLGLAAHAIQDRYARGHADFSLWEGFRAMGFWGALKHLWADMFPSSEERSGAYDATKAMLEGANHSGGSVPSAPGSGGGGLPWPSGICGANMIAGCNSWNDPLPDKNPAKRMSQ